MSQDRLILFKNVYKEYVGIEVLTNINLYIKKNEFLTLLGPSGCGKTTMLRLMGGFEMPTAGDILFEGKSIVNTPPYQRRLNTVFQRYALFPTMNVYENIVLPIGLDGNEPDEPYVKKIIETLGLENKLQNLAVNLSGGQQQRVAIARALAGKPAIILADEPTGNLDSRTSQDVLGLLKITSEQFKQTIVMITHNEEIAQMADRIIRIEDGKIVGDINA